MPPSLHRSNLAVATRVVIIEKTHFILIVLLRERRKPIGEREREREREGRVHERGKVREKRQSESQRKREEGE